MCRPWAGHYCHMKEKVPYIKEIEGGVLIRLHVQPRAFATSFAGVFGDALKLKVKAPPVDGAANEECRRFLAKFFGVKMADITLKTGASSREKTFLIKGIHAEGASRRIRD